MIRCGGRDRAAADWTGLPDQVLELITGRLDSAESCVRLVLVCKSWGSSVFRSWPHKFRSRLTKLVRHPMLLIGDKHVFSAFTGQVFPLDPLILPPHLSIHIGKRCRWNDAQTVTLGSSFGWFFIYNPVVDYKFTMLDSRNPRHHTLCHPITGYGSPHSHSHSHSPSQQIKHAFPRLIGTCPVKIVSNLDPGGRTIHDLLAIWFTSSSDHLLLLEASDKRILATGYKTRFRGRLHAICGRILDIASIDSTVFCLHTTAADLYVSRVSKLLGRPVCGRIVLYEDKLLKAKLPTPPLSRCCRAYLVGSEDSRASWPWLVIRHKTIDRDGKMSTVGFQVFEGVRSVRRRKPTPDTEFSFVRVSKLQNDLLFIGQKSAICLAAGSGLIAAFGLLKPNTVYYLDDGDGENVNTVSDLDMGVFDLEDGCRRPFPIPEHAKQLLSNELMKHHSPPLWFLN